MSLQCSITSLDQANLHKYHVDLASYVRRCWPQSGQGSDPEVAAPGALPPPPCFENLLSICYQASMLREEERPVRLRLLLAGPEQFSSQEFPPMGLHRQVFARPRPLTEQELRKLSPAAAFSRTLVGVAPDPHHAWQIWGLVHSGDRWLRDYQGGRKVPPELPPVPVIHISGPGHLAVLRGLTSVAYLVGGRIITPDLNVFEAQWFQEFFTPARTELLSFIHAAGTSNRNLASFIDPHLMRTIGRHMLMRIISTMRNSHQGGTFLYLPEDRRAEFTAPNPLLTIKYQFQKRGITPRLMDLMRRVLQGLIDAYGREIEDGALLGWRDYISLDNGYLALLDEAIFEVAHQLADFAAVDGAVVLTSKGRVLGFGGMIKGDFDLVKTVARALDLEGEQRQEELTESLGTRHRSVYYLCQQVPDALGIVISQDGSVRLVKWQNGLVTYWEQTISIPLKMV